jgi:hypothetical protein
MKDKSAAQLVIDQAARITKLRLALQTIANMYQGGYASGIAQDALREDDEAKAKYDE